MLAFGNILHDGIYVIRKTHLAQPRAKWQCQAVNCESFPILARDCFGLLRREVCRRNTTFGLVFSIGLLRRKSIRGMKQ